MTVMEFWNELNLIMPPFSTYSISRKKIDIKSFKKLLEDGIFYFSNMKEFEMEAKQLKQFVFLAYNTMRMMKGYQELRKSHQVIERIRRLDVVGVLETFNSYVSDDFNAEIQLPHRQNLDYLLIKLQGFAKVLIRLVSCVRNAAKYILGLVRAGSFYIKGTLYLSTLAKIWDIGRNMCKYVVNLYHSLRTYRDQLKVRENLDWIADNCYLPECLQDWLGIEYEELIANETYDIKLLTKQEDIDDFVKKKETVGQLFTSFKNEANDSIKAEDESTTIEVETKAGEKFDLDDYVPISRKAADEAVYTHSLKEITTKEKVKLFLKFEDKYRKVDQTKSITIKKIKKKDWKEMKKDLSNKLNLMSEAILVEYLQDYLSDFLRI